MTLPALLAANNPVDKAIDYAWLTYDGWWVWSAHIGTLVLSGLILILALPYAASRINTGPESLGTNRYLPRGSFAHLIEVICVYLRDEVVRPQLHGRTDRFMPFLWTIFFFIFLNNLLGLVPIAQAIWTIDWLIQGKPGMYKAHELFVGGTATGNLWVTGALAVIAGIVFNVAAIRELGVKGFLQHLTGGAPMGINAIVFLIEGLGQFVIKPVALCVRLFANMTAGSLIIGTLLLFSNMAFEALPAAFAAPISLAGILAAIALTFLKVFVGLLQAFVFMFLITIFISLMSHHGEEHEHHGHHDHEHAHA